MKYILVLGYGWSGSSAVVDLLKEYESVYQIPVEFRLIKDPGGLMDLRYNIVDRWDPLNVDIAIKRFIWHNDKLNRKAKKIPFRYGLNYSVDLGDDFANASSTFLNDICSNNYYGDWFYFYYDKNTRDWLSEGVKARLLKKDSNQLMYYSNVTGEEFDKYSKKYINSIFENHRNNKEYVILDQAVPSQDPLQAEHYFDDYKIIIVDRDPRDNYCDLVNNGGLVGPELEQDNGVSFFRNWFLEYRKNLKNALKSDSIRYVKFEDLVYEYDKLTKEIEKFVGLNPEDHLHKREFFNPDISKKNIGIWKKYKDQQKMDEIKRTIPEFLSKHSD